MAAIELRQVVKWFGKQMVCKGINLTVADGEFVTLLGPSGCGKTTTLNLIAGLDDVTSGDIHIGGKRVNDLTPFERDVAMVFQNYALYPHMTVAGNIGFTLKLQGLPRSEIAQRVRAVAEALELGPVLDRLPAQLSGGQQQRVALGRAMVRQPQVFLFDEPFSNLDAGLRIRMRSEVKELHQRLRVTSVFVTHDQEEALSLSDRVAIMREGLIEQIGTPEDVYVRPASRYVARFVGSPPLEFLPGRIEQEGGQVFFRVGAAQFALPPQSLAGTAAVADIEMAARPEHVSLGERGAPATVRLVQPVGPSTFVTIDWDGGRLVSRLPGMLRLQPGDNVSFSIEPQHLLFFDGASGKRIP